MCLFVSGSVLVCMSVCVRVEGDWVWEGGGRGVWGGCGWAGGCVCVGVCEKYSLSLKQAPSLFLRYRCQAPGSP